METVNVSTKMQVRSGFQAFLPKIFFLMFPKTLYSSPKTLFCTKNEESSSSHLSLVVLVTLLASSATKRGMCTLTPALRAVHPPLGFYLDHP